MEKLLLILLLFCTGLRANAQSVSGKVLDENKKPIPYANVIILSAKDSSLLVQQPLMMVVLTSRRLH